MHIAIRGDAVTARAQGAEDSAGREGVFQYEQSIPPG